jgi:hypothetical protein
MHPSIGTKQIPIFFVGGTLMHQTIGTKQIPIRVLEGEP